MEIKDYKLAALKLNKFHYEMVDLRIKAKCATEDDIIEKLSESIKRGVEIMLWRNGAIADTLRRIGTSSTFQFGVAIDRMRNLN